MEKKIKELANRVIQDRRSSFSNLFYENTLETTPYIRKIKSLIDSDITLNQQEKKRLKTAFLRELKYNF